MGHDDELEERRRVAMLEKRLDQIVVAIGVLWDGRGPLPDVPSTRLRGHGSPE